MNRYRIDPESKVRLKHFDPDEHRLCKDKEHAKEQTEQWIPRLDTLQERLFAEGQRSVLIVLQGMDTSGKDGVIRHVMRGMNPQGCQVASFKVPSVEEAAHDFLWRVHQKVPKKGAIGIFNRSHYEDVLVTRVHGTISHHEAKDRYKDIRHFEKLLANSGTTILKFFLHISKEEQRQRLQERIDNPQKRWKFSPADLEERKDWKTYLKVFEETIEATSTEYAPWYIVPADHKWYRNWLVAGVLLKALEGMDLRLPSPDPRVRYSKLKIK